VTRIYADFHNLDDQNRIRLNTVGTREDLDMAGLEFSEGLLISLYADDADDDGHPDDLLAEGTVEFNADEKCWVAAVDWKGLTHASEVRPAMARRKRPGRTQP
jgi:hypothetical protein